MPKWLRWILALPDALLMLYLTMLAGRITCYIAYGHYDPTNLLVLVYISFACTSIILVTSYYFVLKCIFIATLVLEILLAILCIASLAIFNYTDNGTYKSLWGTILYAILSVASIIFTSVICLKQEQEEKYIQ